MEDTRAENLRILPQIGDSFLTNKRRPLLTIIEVLAVHSLPILPEVIASCTSVWHRRIGAAGRKMSGVVPSSALAAGYLWRA